MSTGAGRAYVAGWPGRCWCRSWKAPSASDEVGIGRAVRLFADGARVFGDAKDADVAGGFGR